MFKKILAVIVIIISALMLLASLGGIGGVWVVRSEVAGIVNQVVMVADTGLTRAQDRSAQINTQIDQSLTTIGNINSKINTIGDNAQETHLLLIALEQVLDTDLNPAIEQLSQTASDLQSKLTALDSTINTLNKMPPFRKNDSDILDKASHVMDSLQEARQSLMDVRQALRDKKDAITQKTVMILTAPLNRLDQLLTNVQKVNSEIQNSMGEIQTGLLAFQSSLMTALTMAAVVSSVVLLWVALGQTALILLSISVMTGKDLFSSWRVQPANTLTLDAPPTLSDGDQMIPQTDENPAESENTDETMLSS